jgi:hypothetical protein
MSVRTLRFPIVRYGSVRRGGLRRRARRGAGSARQLREDGTLALSDARRTEQKIEELLESGLVARLSAVAANR